MSHLLHIFPFAIMMLSLAACGTSDPAAQTPVSLFSSMPAPTGSQPLPGSPVTPAPFTAEAPASSNFRVAVIVDPTSQQMSRENVGALIAEASGYLRPFSPISLELVDYVEDANGGSTADMAARFIATRSAPLPNGLVIFSSQDNGAAKASDGYGYSLALQGGFTNAFVSPVSGANQVYVAVVDATHPKAATGLYASPPTHFVASMIVHSLLHNFAPNGDRDHYGTPECNASMGYPAGFFDLQQSQYYNDLCPFVYENFTKSYQP